jgi:hypothetical protein
MGSEPYVSRTIGYAARNYAFSLALALLVVSVAFVPLASAKGDEVVNAPSGVAYVTGGVSSEAVDRLKSMEKDFNLKLVFASTSGAYLSDVKLTIADASGRVALDVTTEGPIAMAKLPDGSYQVDATFSGRPQHRTVTIAGNKLITVDFRWPPN